MNELKLIRYMPTINSAKQALDTIIRKSRVHLYKPIQIAEILFHHRTEMQLNLGELESYRNISKRWRDEISLNLVGRRSTSSQKFQDNIFEANAMPPELLTELGTTNQKSDGFIEAYVYKSLEARLSSVRDVERYIETSKPEAFSLKELVALFQTTPGLRRSIDKMYEILVYALFSTIVHSLKARVKLDLEKNDAKILSDFESFIQMVLGIDSKKTTVVAPASLYRVGVTNAADRGLDMWANFGPAVQVKHITLTPEIVEDIADDIRADKIVIVCLRAEQEAIKALLSQVGWGEKIQGIITLDDLEEWYKLCLGKEYIKSLGSELLSDVSREFSLEFPSSTEIEPFMRRRGYDKIVMPPGWEIKI